MITFTLIFFVNVLESSLLCSPGLHLCDYNFELLLQFKVTFLFLHILKCNLSL